MSDRFFRVKAAVTYVGEWFIAIDENVTTPEDAAHYVKSAVGTEDPENMLVDHKAWIDPMEIWLADEDGERVTS